MQKKSMDMKNVTDKNTFDISRKIELCYFVIIVWYFVCLNMNVSFSHWFYSLRSICVSNWDIERKNKTVKLKLFNEIPLDFVYYLLLPTVWQHVLHNNWLIYKSLLIFLLIKSRKWKHLYLIELYVCMCMCHTQTVIPCLSSRKKTCLLSGPCQCEPLSNRSIFFIPDRQFRNRE